MRRDPVFVLHGFYGAGNFGDDWLLAATIAAVARIAPEARFVVRDLGDPVPLPPSPAIAFSHALAVLGDQRLSKPARVLRYLADAWRQLGGKDWLVFGGGTQFHGERRSATLALNAALCLIARARGVRVAALGVGVKGIEGAWARALLRVIVGSARIFAVRDAQSQALAGPRAVLGADLAFTAPMPPPARRGEALALALYPPAWSDRLAEAIVSAVEGRGIVLLEVQRGGTTPGDAPALATLAARLPAAERRRLTHDAEGLSGIGLVCGMRFHALLAAAQAGLPFVGIAHDPKIADLCARLAMPCLEPEAVTGARLAEAIAEAGSRAPSPEAVARCRAEAERALDAFAEAMA
jgi:polysaccharide pyruvyl transferase WcaK-like protein